MTPAQQFALNNPYDGTQDIALYRTVTPIRQRLDLHGIVILAIDR